MADHVGRLVDHVHLRVKDLAASKRFYRAAARALALEASVREADEWFSLDELWIDAADGPVSRVHLAFQAPDEETVQRFHRECIAAGGRDNGAPGLRDYHATYYGAFVLDPDGNNIEAVYHGPTRRSAPAIEITRT
jgi:catechol 2,3-dioxygenase-like lactoylglutathione lyase family enzyme